MRVDLRHGFGSRKAYFNLANLLTVFILIITAWQIWFTIQTTQAFTLQRQISIFVIDRNITPFGQTQFTALVDGQSWLVESNKNLDLGKTYLVQAEFKKGSFDPQAKNFENYQISQGLVGKIKVNQIITLEKSCTLVCQILSNFDRLQKWISAKFTYYSCQNYLTLLKLINPNLPCSQTAELSKGLVIGGVNFSEDLKKAIRVTGLSHVVAVSGFQISLLISFLEIIMLRLSLARNLRVLILISSIFGLLLLVGPQAPVLRASLSAIFSIAALIFFGRRLEVWRSLSYSAVVMLWINPFFIFSYSFLLSFAATLGLINLNFDLKNMGFGKILVDSGLVSLVAFVWTLPILSYLSGQISPVSILINLVIVPFVAPLTLINILSLLPFVGDVFGFFSVVVEHLFLSALLWITPYVPIWNIEKFGIFESFTYYILIWALMKLLASLRWSKNYEFIA